MLQPGCPDSVLETLAKTAHKEHHNQSAPALPLMAVNQDGFALSHQEGQDRDGMSYRIDAGRSVA